MSNAKQNTTSQEHLSAKSADEGILINIWKKILGIQTITTTDNFFILSGNSVLTMQMLALASKECHYNFSLQEFFKNPTISGLVAQKQRVLLSLDKNNISMAKQDITNFEIPTQKKRTHITNRQAKNILLTGANGFLGIHLLSDLLKATKANIYCLIRGSNIQAIQEKLTKKAKKYQLDNILNNERVITIKGDLKKNKLGLSQKDYNNIIHKIDIIYHNGAQVHHMLDYQALRSTNVNSTIEIIKIAMQKRLKTVHYISTLGIAFNQAQPVIAKEPPSINGYLLTKWVAENLLWKAKSYGLDAVIYRPGNITGTSVNGVMDADSNHELLLLKGCIQLEVAPQWNIHIEMTPVDIVSRIILQLSSQKESYGKIYNIHNPNTMLWKDYITEIKNTGIAISLIDPNSWSSKYIANLQDDNALFPLKTYYKNSKNIPVSIKPRKLHIENLMHMYPKDYKRLIITYLKYLKETNFL